MKNTLIIKNLSYEQIIKLIIYSYINYEKSKLEKLKYGSLFLLLSNNKEFTIDCAYYLTRIIERYTDKIDIKHIFKPTKARGIERRIIELILDHFEAEAIALYLETGHSQCTQLLENYKVYYSNRDKYVLPWQKAQLHHILYKALW